MKLSASSNIPTMTTSATSTRTGRNQPCPCGSGKKYKYCCAQAASTSSGSLSTAQHFQEAVRLLQTGHHAEAAGHCRQVLDLQPGHGGANYILGYQALESGDHDTAIRLMEKAIATGLRDPAALYHYGTALARAGHYMDAAKQFAQAVSMKTDFVEARINLANSYFELGAFPEAGDEYRQVIRQAPDNWVAHHNLAHVYYFLGEIDEAVRFFRDATKGDLQYAEAHASLASMLELNNQPEAAEQAVQRALALQPGNASACITLAKCWRRKKQPAAALEALDSIDPSTARDHTWVTLHNEYGQNLDRLDRYAEAYQAFTRSKAAQSSVRRLNYDASREFVFLDQSENYFTREKMHQLQQWVVDSAPDTFSPAPASVTSRPIPLFVTGFHRSGTTLAEQMLSSHPEIGAAGELDMLSNLETRLTGKAASLPTVLEDLLKKKDARPLLDLRQQYLDHLAEKAQDTSKKRWITDKSLFNMLHLPLIRLLFPDAAVIHVIRHPLDTLLSVYMQNFLWGNDWSMTMKDAAHAFSRTAQHVQRILPALDGLRYLPVRYEAMITEPESHIRAMLALAGADYHPACLDFHRNRRVARTASYEQVSRPIYQDSVRRYQRYLPYIEPEVIAALQPVIKFLHYTIETDIPSDTPRL